MNAPRGRFPWRMLLVGLVISSALLFFLLRQLKKSDLSQIWTVLAGLNPWMLAVPIAAGSASAILRPWRWQKIFPPNLRPTFWLSFGALSVGNMANNLVPVRGGDLLRCFLISRKNSLSGASLALATLGLEKVLDGLALLAVLLISFLFISPPKSLGLLLILGALIFGGALCAVLLLHYRTGWFLAATRSLFRAIRLEALGERVATLFEWFAQGLGAVSSPATMAELAVFTVLIWTGDTISVWGLALALHIPLSIPGAALVTAVVGLSQMVPSAPAAVGPYEASSVAALALLQVKFANAMAFTVFMHAWGVLTATLLGVGGLWASGASFSRVMHGQVE